MVILNYGRISWIKWEIMEYVDIMVVDMDGFEEGYRTSN
jgi:hypothetical protein